MTDNPVCVSTWHGDGQKHFPAFLATAKRHGIEPENFDSEFWPGTSWENKEWWRKSAGQERFVRENFDKHSHFMFVDSYDVLFAAGWEEIMAKYHAKASPILWAAECYPWPKTEQAGLYPATVHRCKYLNGGFWIGERRAAIRMLEDVASVARLGQQCDQGIAVDLFLAHKHPIDLDTSCSICFCCNMDSMDYLKFENGRITTTDTGETPCLFHGNANSINQKLLDWLG